jgi:hypothetical protein
MTVTADQMHPQIEAAVYTLERLSAKEREQAPTEHYAQNFNTLLELVKEAMPEVDPRRWPQQVDTTRPSMKQGLASARYVEIHSYLKQMLSILAEGLSPPSTTMMG